MNIVDVFSTVLLSTSVFIALVWLERYWYLKKSKENTFRTLMRTRVDPFSIEHLVALGKVEVLFSKSDKIIAAYGEYVYWLMNKKSMQGTHVYPPYTDTKVKESLSNLLIKIADKHGYHFKEINCMDSYNLTA